jgi:glycosyltransferase involved in cell wall biosynthesis
VQRALSLARYLPQCDFEVHVLKATNAGGPVMDPDLLRLVPSSVVVHEAFTPEIPFAVRQKIWSMLARTNGKASAKASGGGLRPKAMLAGAVKRLLCPEPEILWVPFAVRKARQIIRRQGIEFLLVTVPPFSALVAGNILKRDFPELKLISDFRDEWLSFYLKDFDFQNSDYTRRRAEAIEGETVRRANLVVAVNQSSRDEIRRRYPDQPEDKFVVVPNGYDPVAFAGFRARSNRLPRMLVTHVGTVYKTASPRFYLDALDALPEQVRDQIETRFIGRISDDERAPLESRRSNVKMLGFIPQAEALKTMEATDYLLLTMTNEISVPGKLFEYMASGKPILAVTPKGSEVDRILQETGTGICSAPDDRAGIQAMISRAFDGWQKKQPIMRRDEDRVRRYERPGLVQEYAALMTKLI